MHSRLRLRIDVNYSNPDPSRWMGCQSSSHTFLIGSGYHLHHFLGRSDLTQQCCKQSSITRIDVFKRLV